MNVIIFGCGRTGAALARMLSSNGDEVTVIEREPEHLARLGHDHGCRVIIGDGLDDDVLLDAGIRDADAFIASTRGDNTNLMAAQVAQTRYGVSMVCAKVNDPDRAREYRKMGVFSITPNLLTAGMMRDWLLGRDFSPIDAYNKAEGEE